MWRGCRNCLANGRATAEAASHRLSLRWWRRIGLPRWRPAGASKSSGCQRGAFLARPWHCALSTTELSKNSKCRKADRQTRCESPISITSPAPSGDTLGSAHGSQGSFFGMMHRPLLPRFGGGFFLPLSRASKSAHQPSYLCELLHRRSSSPNLPWHRVGGVSNDHRLAAFDVRQ
jgi:hypothetical protein